MKPFVLAHWACLLWTAQSVCEEWCMKESPDPCNWEKCNTCPVCELAKSTCADDCPIIFQNPCDHKDRCDCPFCKAPAKSACPEWCKTEYANPCENLDFCGDCCDSGAPLWERDYKKTRNITCFAEAKSWMDAAAHCKSLGKSLMTVKDAYDTAYLLSHACFSDANYHGWKCMWIGLNDHKNEGRWSWLSGTELKYTNWGPGEPNNWGGREDCAEMCRNFQVDGQWGKWNDGHCDRPLSYCCDDLTSGDIPTPTAPGYDKNVFHAEIPKTGAQGNRGKCEMGWVPGGIATSGVHTTDAAVNNSPMVPMVLLSAACLLSTLWPAS
eukprot:TRINITY_DN83185_c0_g1_i1.p1 TRINITY_DN83185_c0_g1~~TRINITY_DN83185_c0_g1_i1.p1  ORF type:complete len:324 (+),score=31.98 TRINITY_DN83185_c0_g1_i1:81-1052(+)